ncbi:hypothetical protein DPMN_057905 [Dreissena polymorpha]|uniref:Uncharacterized protein n=1 Tax=Dreissena polymorpha TaxID=45954 RepID=A0A9D4C150_DREPO|nr:hypothetical protein DPMN_057905 [Dreissena polymorpha]
MRRSTSDHTASAIIRALPVDVTGHVMTGPFTWHWSLTGPVAGHWVVPGNVTGHFMTGPFIGPGTEQDVRQRSFDHASTSYHMAPAIRRYMLSDVDRVALAMRCSTSDHIASAVLRS